MEEDPEFDENAKYDEFPPGDDSNGNGPGAGFNTWIKINDADLFDADQIASNPALQAFLEAPFSLNFAQFKSSHREAEYWIHKPDLAMTGQVGPHPTTGLGGINGGVEDFPTTDPIVPTLVINHENSLAYHVTRTVVIADGKHAGQIVHKEKGPNF